MRERSADQFARSEPQVWNGMTTSPRSGPPAPIGRDCWLGTLKQVKIIPATSGIPPQQQVNGQAQQPLVAPILREATRASGPSSPCGHARELQITAFAREHQHLVTVLPPRADRQGWALPTCGYHHAV